MRLHISLVESLSIKSEHFCVARLVVQFGELSLLALSALIWDQNLVDFLELHQKIMLLRINDNINESKFTSSNVS